MFSSIKKLPHPIPKADKPDPKAAQALQEGLGGQFGAVWRDAYNDAVYVSEHEF